VIDDRREKKVADFVLHHAHCQVFLAPPPEIPSELDQE